MFLALDLFKCPCNLPLLLSLKLSLNVVELISDLTFPASVCSRLQLDTVRGKLGGGIRPVSGIDERRPEITRWSIMVRNIVRREVRRRERLVGALRRGCGRRVPGGGIMVSLQDIWEPQLFLTEVQGVISGRETVNLLHWQEYHQPLDRKSLLDWSLDLSCRGGLLLDLGLSGDCDVTNETMLVRFDGRHSASPEHWVLELALVLHQHNVPDSHVTVHGSPLLERNQGFEDNVEPNLPPGSEGLLNNSHPRADSVHVSFEVSGVSVSGTGPSALEKEVGCDHAETTFSTSMVPDTERTIIDD